MDIELIFKVAGVGIIVSVLNILLKKAERDEQALMTTLAGLVVVLMMLIDYIEQLFDAVRSAFGI
ncbi:MAG: stage III sporulation protein AC [Oscillospiraceae bacterium]|nr:stage III sporulation protein AC [Ruminococcus sp.]MDE6592383.1 stage III sporulation protein AC [Oscillospiraceae bacterium]MDE7295155.1 stage III sporulation protein AC [Oscillospiraceae bacterium]